MEIISTTTYSYLKDQEYFLVRKLDKVIVKGKQEAISIFEVFNNDPDEIISQKLQTLEIYHQGLAEHSKLNNHQLKLVGLNCGLKSRQRRT